MRTHRPPRDAKLPGRGGRRARVSPTTGLSALPGWKLEDAKAKLSELVRCARTQGPQRVTCRGEDAVVVVAADEFARLLAKEPAQPSLVAFLRSSGLGDLEVSRELDRGREVDL